MKAYDYLPNSIAAFPQGEKMKEALKRSGFTDVEIRKFTMETCTFYLAIK
jgi:demethylmenaquinone methyltransferase/2-methoxy-6-polyprenyl-1,4-benzoquinol methylase